MYNKKVYSTSEDECSDYHLAMKCEQDQMLRVSDMSMQLSQPRPAFSLIVFLKEPCQFAVVPCPHHKYGCTEKLPRSDIAIHENKCAMTCKWCKEKVHNEKVSLQQAPCMLAIRAFEFCNAS